MQNNEAQTTDRQVAVEKVLLMHPGVRDAAVVHVGGDGIVTFVVPDDLYIDDISGRETAGTTVMGKWRKLFDLTQFTKEAASAPVGFNTIGWNSSYTRQPIPAENMHEWVSRTVEDILQLAPSAMYEIGCGTGMLLIHIAPYCKRYIAVDFSSVVLNTLREQLRKVPSVAEKVKLMERRADNFDGLEENSFDTVVLNSVVQYFPNVAYLTKVLENAINIVRPGGHIFVGDVRSLPLLPTFASSVEMFQAVNEARVDELRERIKRRVQRDPEFVLSPAFFLSLRRRFAKISRVEIRPKRGRGDTEMSRYRYAAIIHVGQETEAASEAAFQDWTERPMTLDEIRSMLQGRRESFGIQKIRNARLENDLRLMERLRTADAALTVGELRREIEQCNTRGIHPQDLLDLEAENLGFRVLLSWAASRADGSYDAFFIPTRPPQHQFDWAVNWPQPELSDFVQLATSPGQGKFRSALIDLLVEHCRQNLPAELAPCDVALVDMIPRAVDGTVDSEGLLAARSMCF